MTDNKSGEPILSWDEREDFRKHLQETGTMEVITTALAELYMERVPPHLAKNIFLEKLSLSLPEKRENIQLLKETHILEKKLARINSEIEVQKQLKSAESDDEVSTYGNHCGDTLQMTHKFVQTDPVADYDSENQFWENNEPERPITV